MKRIWLMATAALLGTAGAAQAETIIDTGGNSSGAGWSFSSSQYFAGEFSIGKAYTLTAVSGYFNNSFGSTGTVAAQLFADGGNIPGALLYSQAFTLQGGASTNWYGATGLDWTLASGTYWLGFAPGAGISGTWNGNAPSPLAEYAQNQGAGWQDRGANFYDYLDVGLRASGDAVVAAPVPEPATWALMLLGFGGAAVALRRREKVAARVRFA